MFYSCVNSYELFGDVILFDSSNTLFMQINFITKFFVLKQTNFVPRFFYEFTFNLNYIWKFAFSK